MINLLHIFLALVLTSAPLLAQNPADTPREIAGHRTIHGAQVSARPMPIPTRYVFDEKRDWVKQPFRLAVVLIEFSDKKHTDIHSAAFYDGVLFPATNITGSPMARCPLAASPTGIARSRRGGSC